MKTYLFFGYRDWAINIFKALSANGDNWILITDNRSCSKEIIDRIKPNIIFFYGWSWIVPDYIVNNYNCFCLHPSPLPKYRGGSPLQNQIIEGETESAVTIFKMTQIMDAGDIVYQEIFSLGGSLEEIFSRIIFLGIKGTLKLIDNYMWNTVESRPQNDSEATYCSRRKPQDSCISPMEFSQHNAKYFYDMVRALQPPYPECYINCKEGKLIIEKVRYEL